MEDSPIRGSAGPSPRIPQDMPQFLKEKPGLDFMSIFTMAHHPLPYHRSYYGQFPFEEFFSSSVDDCPPPGAQKRDSVFAGRYETVDLGAQELHLPKMSVPYKVSGKSYRHREEFFVNTKDWKMKLAPISRQTRQYLHGMLKSYSNWEINLELWTNVFIFKTSNPLILVFVLKTTYFVHRGYLIFHAEDPTIVPKVTFLSNEGFCPISKATNLVDQDCWSMQWSFYAYLNDLWRKQQIYDDIRHRCFSPEIRTTPLGSLVKEQALVLSGMIRKTINKKSLKCFHSGAMGALVGECEYNQLFSSSVLEENGDNDTHQSSRKRPATGFSTWTDFATRSSCQQQDQSLPPIETFSGPMEIEYPLLEHPGQQAETLSENIIFPELQHIEQSSGQQVEPVNNLQQQELHPSFQNSFVQDTFIAGYPNVHHQLQPSFSMAQNTSCYEEQQHSSMYMDFGPATHSQGCSYSEIVQPSTSLLNFNHDNQQPGHAFGHSTWNPSAVEQYHPPYYHSYN